MSTSVVKCSWLKCSDSLSNRVSHIIRRYIYIYIDHMNFAAYVAFYFIIFLHVLLALFIILYIVVCFVYFRLICRFCIFIVMFMYSYCYAYVFILLFMLCSVYSVFIAPTGTLRLP